MYFLEKKRKSWSQPGSLDPSLTKELEAYQQKAKEMAEVRRLVGHKMISPLAPLWLRLHLV